jgi:hypothetical protein
MMQRALSIIAVGSVILMLVLSTAVNSVSGQTASPTPGRAEALSTDCKTSDLTDIMAVYMSTPGPRTTPVPFPPNVRSYLAQKLQARLLKCAALFGAENHDETNACTPAQDEIDPRELWTHLKTCEGLAHPPAGTASTVIKWSLPAASGTAGQPIIFIVGGGGGDAAMIQKLTSSLAAYLNDGKANIGFRFANDAVLLPEPTWSPEQFLAQCEKSPQVEGAIVLQITASGSGASDEFIRRRNWTAIEATALYAQCDHKHPGPGSPMYTWASSIQKKEKHYTTLTPLTPLALLLTLGAGYEVFAPSRTSSTQTTTVLPNPTPIPTGGRVSQITTTNSTTLNAASVGSVGASFLSFTNSTTPLTQQTSVDKLTWDTLQELALQLIKDMNCWQPQPSPKGKPNAADVIGSPRTLPAYSPPTGLSAYSSGRPSAPFCSEPQASESIYDLLPATPAPAPKPTPRVGR